MTPSGGKWPWGAALGERGLATQKGWMKLYGGDLWLLGAPEQPVGSAAVSREGETPLVRELLCPEALRAQALESLCKALESRELRLALPGAGAGGRPADRADDDGARNGGNRPAGGDIYPAGDGLKRARRNPRRYPE
ncbi:MAG: hypothetical protein ACLTY5_05985 [Angelakisella sp.]